MIKKVFVIAIILYRVLERSTASIEDKESNTKGKNIHILTLVVLIQKHLRSHEAGGAENGRVYAERDDVTVFVSTIATFKTTRKPKVGDFDVIIPVKQDVMGIDVAMGEAFLVNVVQTLQ